MKKFFAVIGNPPYQDQTVGDQRTYAPPIYHQFMDSAAEVAERVELVTPARFLFNAGSTPKAWNEKMLQDSHFKVLHYEADGKKIFPDTEIKGGVAVTIRDSTKQYGSIGVFIPYEQMRSILDKVRSASFNNLCDIVFAPERYKFTELMHADHPEIEGMLSKGHKFDLKSNVLDKLDGIAFFDNKPRDGLEYARVMGVVRNKRTTKWIRCDYLKVPENFNKYKVFVPKAVGSGEFGEKLPELIIAAPMVGHTQTFASLGEFESEDEVKSLAKYLSTKFVRALISIYKVTQDVTSRVFTCVPMQDFTAASDIDWAKPVADIDRQLYRKYGLTDDEVAFIESHVKEMS